MVESDVEGAPAGQTVDLHQELEVPAPPGGERPERSVVGVEPGGERERADAGRIAEQLTSPGDPSRPREGDRGVDQPSRAGEIGIDHQAAGLERRELDGPALRPARHLQRQRGGGGALGGATGIELDLSADALPEVTAACAGGPEGVPTSTEDLDPVLHRLGEDGEDEERDGGHGTPLGCARER
jgi:hypothetical protein